MIHLGAQWPGQKGLDRLVHAPMPFHHIVDGFQIGISTQCFLASATTALAE